MESSPRIEPFGSQRLRLSQHVSALIDHILPFPTHADNWSRGSGTEWFGTQIGIMRFPIFNVGHTILRPTSCLFDRVLKRRRSSPTSPRWTPSGLIVKKVRS
jgi:hypothetical protein